MNFTPHSHFTFPPVYIWSCYTPVLDLSIRNGSLCMHEIIACCPLYITLFIVWCSSQLHWAVAILLGSPGLWSHTILVVKLCFPKSHIKTFSSQIPKLHKTKAQQSQKRQTYFIKDLCGRSAGPGCSEGGNERFLRQDFHGKLVWLPHKSLMFHLLVRRSVVDHRPGFPYGYECPSIYSHLLITVVVFWMCVPWIREIGFYRYKTNEKKRLKILR